ncbi:hypothetical protein DYB26_012973 [Aphanomyces astaci]|uniref:N-acetyltransferase domain-containing protein n=1 Tax=Aphanomyces astaci TaxID=112090 RepID=A0A397E2V4_APHAT|nr:hypothetical protein DYB34_012455 [Aphanomyces astaci]RHY75335.1 hypothetical protein DYB38_012173 [Aphanomyces astaci]RHY80598.1 hypothetical protein DYB31_006104 [Aphanomyces astaci]RHZ31521.1 hypothetical protein DYB26_012973 [Aphanomyces astaci]
MIRTRHATSADESALVTCINEAFRPANLNLKKPECQHRCNLHEIRRLLSTANSTIFVAEQVLETDADGNAATTSSVVSGCVYVSWEYCDDDVLVGHLSLLSVPKEFSKRGIGNRLMDVGEALVARQATALTRDIRLDISVMSIRGDLRAFYERRGYKATGKDLDAPGFAATLNDQHAHVRLLEMQLHVPVLADFGN